MGGVAIGVQSFYARWAARSPVIGGVAATPIDGQQKNTAVILFGDATTCSRRWAPTRKDVLHAKTAALVYPRTTPGIAPAPLADRGGAEGGRHLRQVRPVTRRPRPT